MTVKADPLRYVGDHSRNALPIVLMNLQDGCAVDYTSPRLRLCDLLSRFEDGRYEYVHTESFNPAVARELREQTARILREGATLPEVQDLVRTYESIMDNYAIETGRPENTSQALDELRRQLLAERRDAT